MPDRPPIKMAFGDSPVTLKNHKVTVDQPSLLSDLDDDEIVSTRDTGSSNHKILTGTGSHPFGMN